MNGRRPNRRMVRRYQSGGMTRENNMQRERMMDQGMRREAQQNMQKVNPEQELIKQMLMEEIQRQRQGYTNDVPSPREIREMKRIEAEGEMDRKMLEAAKRYRRARGQQSPQQAPPPQQRNYRMGGMARPMPTQGRGYKMGGMTKPTMSQAQKMRLARALMARKGR